MERSFQLHILEEDKLCYAGEALYCSAVTSGGSIGFEALHEGFAAPLLPGSSFSYRTPDGNEKELPVNWGMLLFHDNRCIVTLAG